MEIVVGFLAVWTLVLAFECRRLDKVNLEQAIQILSLRWKLQKAQNKLKAEEKQHGKL